MAGFDVYLPIICVHISKAPASYEARAGLFPYAVSELSMPCSEGSGDSITPLFFKTGRCPYNPHTKKNRTQNRSLTDLCVLFGCFALRQHRTMGAAGFGGSFVPIVQYEKWEIHPVFPHFPYFRLGQNLSPNLLAPLCGVAQEIVLQL